jgi:hypothetical protein
VLIIEICRIIDPDFFSYGISLSEFCRHYEQACPYGIRQGWIIDEVMQFLNGELGLVKIVVRTP